MSDAVSFESYLASLGRLTAHVDPTASTPEAENIREAVASLTSIQTVETTALADWVAAHPDWVAVLGLVVGLSQEKLKNALRDKLDTSGFVTLARTRATDLITVLDEDFDLLRLLRTQIVREYGFADVLIARAGPRVTAFGGQASGRKVEDEIAAIAEDLGLSWVARSRYTGRNNRTAPADLIVPDDKNALIVVAAKGFDSTGSKLTDAVREIEEMAEVRLPTQFVFAVIDGIGWKSRQADLKRIHALWANKQIDGMYTLASLDKFRDDLEAAAHRLKLV
ncbi:hypothetical protein MB901379_00481 [Mycobacterium basiliense]|uniref:Restriction endonuclease type II DpnII-like domain-containing protein n=1 Tax=Mycobacterium basiliense TaxID=2094119 RepID=A0A447G9F0_9MYCO|nr:DpnII family type II restriction endonuclease [Mycobacterium basiliense]VDM86952.1 hypothetical protein MB901379_00481 [Mycobacterium basiliense]